MAPRTMCLRLLAFLAAASASAVYRTEDTGVAPAGAGGAKIVGLVPIRNEERRIGFCLRALAMFVDEIVVLDDSSTDATVAAVRELSKECRVSRIITKGSWVRDETADRNALLASGRAVGGTHFVVIDADEAFTGNLADGDDLREQILALDVGQSIALFWIQLWKSVHYFRTDRLYTEDGALGPVPSVLMMPCAFRDDGTSVYEGEFIHTRRIPEALSGSSIIIQDMDVGLLHFQFVNWPNFLLKQAWYKCFERIRLPEKSASDIQARYANSLDEIGERVAHVFPSWFARYEDILNPEDFLHLDTWRVQMLQEWFHEHGSRTFEGIGVENMLRSIGSISASISTFGSESSECKDRKDSGVFSRVTVVLATHSTLDARAMLQGLSKAIQGLDSQECEVLVSSCVTDSGGGFSHDMLLELPRGFVAVGWESCGDAGDLVGFMNAAARRSTGDVLAFVTGCVQLEAGTLKSLLKWYKARMCNRKENHALLSFAEDCYVSDRWQTSDSFFNDLEAIAPTYPEDAGDEYKHHWRFGGGLVAVPQQAFETLNGFGQLDGGLRLQMLHLMDRARIHGCDVWIAPLSMRVKRVFGADACMLTEELEAEIIDRANAPPPNEDASLRMLADIRSGKRSSFVRRGFRNFS